MEQSQAGADVNLDGPEYNQLPCDDAPGSLSSHQNLQMSATVREEKIGYVELGVHLPDTVGKLRQLGVDEWVVTGPNPFRDGPAQMLKSCFSAPRDLQDLQNRPPVNHIEGRASMNLPDAWSVLGDEESLPAGSYWKCRGFSAGALFSLPIFTRHAFDFALLSEKQPASQAQEAIHVALSQWTNVQRLLTTRQSILSKRERQALWHTYDGLSVSDCAEKMGLTERTYEFHVSNARRKLNARNTTSAVRVALLLGIL